MSFIESCVACGMQSSHFCSQYHHHTSRQSTCHPWEALHSNDGCSCMCTTQKRKSFNGATLHLGSSILFVICILCTHVWNIRTTGLDIKTDPEFVDICRYLHKYLHLKFQKYYWGRNTWLGGNSHAKREGFSCSPICSPFWLLRVTRSMVDQRGCTVRRSCPQERWEEAEHRLSLCCEAQSPHGQWHPVTQDVRWSGVCLPQRQCGCSSKNNVCSVTHKQPRVEARLGGEKQRIKHVQDTWKQQHSTLSKKEE